MQRDRGQGGDGRSHEGHAPAQRELQEETGITPLGPFVSLGSVIQKSGKVVHAWAASHDESPITLRSNPVEIEWPARSGKRQSFPELDRAEYFSIATARQKLNPAQVEFLDRLLAHLAQTGEAHAGSGRALKEKT